MATRKQRRRRAKEHRHDYVWVDEEGQEIDPPAENGATKPGGSQASHRGGRQAQAPSWRRAFKRGGIFAPIMLGTVMLLSKSLTLAQQVTQTLFIVAVFVPFSYFLDRVFYRSAQRRAGKGASTGSRRGG